MTLDPPLLQRVAMKIRLSTLTEEATKAYVVHRMAIAGTREPIFTDAALKLIYRYSDGFPRKINILCDNALFQGFLMRQRVIDESIVEEMASDLGFDARLDTEADIPSLDIPADWSPQGVQTADQANGAPAPQTPEQSLDIPPIPEVPEVPEISEVLDIPDIAVPQPVPETVPEGNPADDLDVKLEEFFEETFKDN
jgi:hypothetical protein